MNVAARTSACPTFLPADAVAQIAPEQPQREEEAHVSLNLESDPDSGTADNSKAQQCPEKRKSTHASTDADKAKRGKVEEKVGKQDSPALVLKTAEIDWEAASGPELDSNDETEDAAVSPHDERSEFEVFLCEEELRQATLHFVKAILNPLYHSQVSTSSKHIHCACQDRLRLLQGTLLPA